MISQGMLPWKKMQINVDCYLWIQRIKLSQRWYPLMQSRSGSCSENFPDSTINTFCCSAAKQYSVNETITIVGIHSKISKLESESKWSWSQSLMYLDKTSIFCHQRTKQITIKTLYLNLLVEAVENNGTKEQQQHVTQ